MTAAAPADSAIHPCGACGQRWHLGGSGYAPAAWPGTWIRDNARGVSIFRSNTTDTAPVTVAHADVPGPHELRWPCDDHTASVTVTPENDQSGITSLLAEVRGLCLHDGPTLSWETVLDAPPAPPETNPEPERQVA